METAVFCMAAFLVFGWPVFRSFRKDDGSYDPADRVPLAVLLAGALVAAVVPSWQDRVYVLVCLGFGLIVIGHQVLLFVRGSGGWRAWARMVFVMAVLIATIASGWLRQEMLDLWNGSG